MNNLLRAEENDELITFSKNVTKVQKLPNLSTWNESTAILRDYMNCRFTKKSRIFRLNQELTIRKRVIVVTLDDCLLVYETNSTGYSFQIGAALKLKTSCTSRNPLRDPNVFNNIDEKTCVVTLKYQFGSVSLVLIGRQISIWRRTLSTIFEGEILDNSLITDISLYTARDDWSCDDDDNTFQEPNSIRSNRSITDDSLHSIKSALPNLSEMSTAMDMTDAFVDTARTNSNRSLTYIPESVSAVSVSNSRKTQTGVKCRSTARSVSFLAKRFEEKMKESFGKRRGESIRDSSPTNKPPRSPPIEVLFPPLPVKKLSESQNDGDELVVSKLDYTPCKN